MGDETKIQWTDHTFNPWLGCEKVSAGCKNCYAENDTPVRVHRGKGLELWGGDAARVVTGADNWRKPARWNRAAQAEGLRRRVFCASLADVFEDRRDLDAPRARLFALIEQTPWLDWQLVTKRPENMVRLAPASWAKGWPANVWAGTTVEDQPAADERIPHLLRVPAVVRFLSMEPMLGAVDLRKIALTDEQVLLLTGIRDVDRRGLDWARPWTLDALCSKDRCAEGLPSFGMGAVHSARAVYWCHGINWIIIGGESGPKARPFDLAWARSIIAQADEAGVPVFLKQLGARPYDSQKGVPVFPGEARALANSHPRHLCSAGLTVPLRDSHGGNEAEWPEDLRGRRVFPKVAA